MLLYCALFFASSLTVIFVSHFCIEINFPQCLFASATFHCTESGLFADPYNCSRYILCKPDRFGASPHVHIRSCPENTAYNPFLRKCDSFYNCNGIDPHGGVDPCQDSNYDYPVILTPHANDATFYILCRYFVDVSHILRKDCPEETFFSPYLHKCYHNYDPNETCSKDACSGGPGEYVNYKSGKCESYIECRDEVRAFGLYEPTYDIRYCPDGTQFNPETRKCRKTYVCPTFPENYCYPQITAETTTSEPTQRG